MKQYINPKQSDFKTLIQRPSNDLSKLFDIVQPIITNVNKEGDTVLYKYAEKYDNASISSLIIDKEEIKNACKQLPVNLIAAIVQAYHQIYAFHKAQEFKSIQVETIPGVYCEQRAVPISSVGLYIPGGTAPLFSTVLMLGVPAQIAGCKEIVLCTPPTLDGSVNPAILFAASLCSIDRIYKVGGAQAIAAMAYGTESIPKVDKIFGPGNQYVLAAKQWVAMQGTAIDMPAGPSEVEVLADESANIKYVAADLLSQAEHGIDSQVMLVTTNEDIASQVMEEIRRQIVDLPRKEIVDASLKNSKIIVFESMEQAIDFTNQYAPEHLIIATANSREISLRITNAGSIFLGNFSCESAGDYASGTNHTLPTMGYAKSYSSLGLDSFMRKLTVQEITDNGIRVIGKTVEIMAEAEGLTAHKRAMTYRLNDCQEESSSITEHKISSLVRPNVRTLKAYSSARSECSDFECLVRLDANESPFNGPYNRYPDPLQTEVKKRIAELKEINSEQIFLGNGSDECIDLLFRTFCRPHVDNVVAFDPTYGMYEVCASLNEVEYRKVPLEKDFSMNAEMLLSMTDENTKIIFMCNPNNPTGNLLSANQIEEVLENFMGIVVIDEAYMDFAPRYTMRNKLDKYPKLVILGTFSKAWSSAGIRLGMINTSSEIIEYLNKVKYPYNVSYLTQEYILDMLERESNVVKWINIISSERIRVSNAIRRLPFCQKVYPSAANFVLAKFKDSKTIYEKLKMKGIIVRDRSKMFQCENCLRITIGSKEENDYLLKNLNDMI